MGYFLFAIILGIICELLWFKFYRDGKKQFIKYDKDHSTVVAQDSEEVISRLNKISHLRISDVSAELNQVKFVCEKNNYAIAVENSVAYVEYDMSGCEVRLSLIGKLIKRIKFRKSVHAAILINMIMDTFQNDSLQKQKEYKKTKNYAKASIIAFVAFLILLVIGCFNVVGSAYDDAISEAKMMEFEDYVTYGEIFDEYLIDAEWTAFNSENDIAVIEVTGISVEGEHICIQFWGNMGMGFSYIDLTLEYFEADGFSLDPDVAMRYIYSRYYLN